MPSLRLLLLLILALSVSACFRHSAPVHFYMLQPIKAPHPRTEWSADAPTVGLGPIRVADYLNRLQIVTAISDQEYRIAEDHRWAESLDDAAKRVLAENLSNLIPTERIVFHPWPAKQVVDARIGIDIQEFHADASGQVRLTALWTFEGTDKKAERHKFTCRQPASATDYAQIVAAQSACLGDLSREIATRVRALFPS